MVEIDADATAEFAALALDRALAAAADALAALPPSEWHKLCREEAADQRTFVQWINFAGFADEAIPERIIGARIVRHLVARHPLFASDAAGQA